MSSHVYRVLARYNLHGVPWRHLARGVEPFTLDRPSPETPSPQSPQRTSTRRVPRGRPDQEGRTISTRGLDLDPCAWRGADATPRVSGGEGARHGPTPQHPRVP